MNTFQHLLAYLQQTSPAVAGGPSVDSFARALYRDLARDAGSFGDNVTPFSPPPWRPHSGKFLDVVWLRDVLERFSWFDPETVDVRVGQLARIDGGPNRLGVYYDLGLVTIRVQRPRTARSDADEAHPQLSEAAVRELFSGWVRATAGGDLELLRELRRNFTLYVVVDGDAFDAPQVRTAGAAQLDQADGPTIGVITVNLRDLHSGSANAAAIRAQLDQALEPLSGRGAAGRPGGDWHAVFGNSGLSVRDRFRERVKQVIQDLMGLLEETAGTKGHASDDAALGHLREAASLVFFRLIFLVTLENRNLLWKTSATKLRVTWPSFEELVVRRRSAIRGETGLLQGLLYRSREVRSVAKKSPLAIHGASIFRSRPSDDFHEEIERWLSPLDGLEVLEPRLSAKLLAAWEAALAEAVAVAQGQIGEVSEGAHAIVGLGASAHAQRVLGDVYEQILAMQPVREASKSKTGRIVLRVAGGKAAKIDAATGGKADPTKNERHALGAHYTPELLVNEVVRAGIEPLLRDAWRRAGGSPAVDPSQRPPRADAAVLKAYEREILNLRIVDPAMGSGHFLTVTVLELAREIAYTHHFGAPQPAEHFEVASVPEPWTRLEDPTHGGEPGLMHRLDDVATAHLQDLAQRCCYGVDRKPLAVELGKLALWLMTMVARRRLDTTAQAELPEAPPLTFLDKNLRSGDSLLGLTWPEARETLQALGIDLGEERQGALFDSAGFKEPNLARAYEHLSDALGLPDTELRARMPDLMRETDAIVDAATKKRIHAAGEMDSNDLSALRGEWFVVMRELADGVSWKWDLALLRRFYPKKGQLEKTLGVASIKSDEATIAKIKHHARGLGVFHWPLMFSEVFDRENKGFDGIVANPPFKGDRDLRAAIGEAAVTYLRNRYVDGVATLDLCGFFIRQFDRLLGERASFSTVAPNSIGQGRNRTAGLRPLITGDKPRFVLYRAVQTMPWPGDAAVHIALLAGRRAASATVSVREVGSTLPARSSERRALRRVTALSSFLDGGVELTPFRLPSGSAPIAFTGMFPRGLFDFELDDPAVANLPERERRVLYAYLNNKDVQSQPRPHARRVIIDVYDALVTAGKHQESADEQEIWLRKHLPRTMALLEPAMAERRKLPASARNSKARAYPWIFEEVRPGLRAAWASLDSVIAIGAVGKTFVPFRLPRRDHETGFEVLPTHQLFMVASDLRSVYAVLSTAIFEGLTRRMCSTMEDRLRFAPSQVFPYFPFPWTPFIDKAKRRLNPLVPPKGLETTLGKAATMLLDHRQRLLEHPEKHGLGNVGKGDNFGATKLYNFYDDPDCMVPAIQQLRDLHVALTRAVFDAYGWTDFKPTWEFGTPWIDGTTRYFPNAESRAEILARLQTLNHERHALEVDLCHKHNIPVPAATVDNEEEDPEGE